MILTEKKLACEALFWAHLGFIISALLIGLFFSPLVVLALVLAHRLHVFIFDECLLSKAQRKLGGLPGDISFFQLAAKRIFQQDITKWQSSLLDYGVVSLSFIIAFLR